MAKFKLNTKLTTRSNTKSNIKLPTKLTTRFISRFTTSLIVGGALFCSAIFALGACNGGSTSSSGEANQSKGDSAIMVQGSDTMENLTQKWARDYMASNKGIQISVQPGDTGSGVSDLLSGKIDLAAASRELTDAEQKLAHNQKIHLKRLMVARDAVAVVVNPQNKLKTIDLVDLEKIYSGEIILWNQLDPALAKEPIRVFGREASSGTSDYFQAHVLKGKPFGSVVKLMPSSESLIGAIMGNRLAIGFVGMAQAQKAADTISVLQLKLTAASPNLSQGSDLFGNDYPLSRPLYLYYNAANESRVKKFVDYCLSTDGQKTVGSMGFMPAH